MIGRHRACTTHCPEENNLTSPLTHSHAVNLHSIYTQGSMWQETDSSALHQSAQLLSALPLKPGAVRRVKGRQQAKFCHPRSVASKFSFPWLFIWAHTHAALVPKWQLQDLCLFSCSHFSHLPVGKEHLLLILVCSHRGKNFLRPASTTSRPLPPQNRKGLFYHKLVLCLEIACCRTVTPLLTWQTQKTHSLLHGSWQRFKKERQNGLQNTHTKKTALGFL